MATASPAAQTTRGNLRVPSHEVRDGLPYERFEALRGMLGVPARDLAAVLRIPERTLARRKEMGTLPPEESDRLARLLRIVSFALEVFDGSEARAARWLTTPKTLLGGESPLAYADTDPGAQEVEDMLYSIEYTTAA